MLAARNVGPVWLRLPLRGLFAVIRAVPEVIIALLLLTVTGLTPSVSERGMSRSAKVNEPT